MKRKHWIQEVLTQGPYFLALCVTGLFVTSITGCGEEMDDPLRVREGATETLGTLKVPDMAPGAPQVTTGTPTVTSVGYYADWRLTQPTGAAAPGTTFWIKVVFSEPMQMHVADNNTARPILYYKGAEGLVRFRIAKHGAGGEDFVSGDAKPWKEDTDIYICKYTVPDNVEGEFTIAVGRLNTDKDGNNLTAFYTHQEKLQIGQSPPFVTSVEYYRDWRLTKPVTGTVQPGTLVFTKIVFSEEMEHVISDSAGARPELYYRIGDRDIRHNIVPFHLWQQHYVSGDTKPVNGHTTYIGKYRIEKSDYGSFTLVVGENSADKHGIPLDEAYVHQEVLHIPAPEPIDSTVPTVTPVPETGMNPVPGERPFSGFVYIPRYVYYSLHDRSNVTPVEGAIITVVSGQQSGTRVITTSTGQYTFPSVAGNELHIRVEKGGFEPKEVTVHRTQPTTLSDGTVSRYGGDPQNTPGNILIGHRWPDEVRHILRQVTVAPDLLYVGGLAPPTERDTGGVYESGLVFVFSNVVRHDVPHVAAHEIAHAHQHYRYAHEFGRDALQHGTKWGNSPQGKAFADAKRKDLAEVGEVPYDVIPHFLNSLAENAAETLACYWISNNAWGGINLEVVAPNRFRWAQQWLR